MIMVNLIGILLIGGLLAMISERFGDTIPRKVAMAVVLIDLLYLLICLSGMPEITQLQAPLANDPSTWLMHFKTDWIPAFGISIELALDGISLLMVLLFLGICIAIIAWMFNTGYKLKQ